MELYLLNVWRCLNEENQCTRFQDFTVTACQNQLLQSVVQHQLVKINHLWMGDKVTYVHSIP